MFLLIDLSTKDNMHLALFDENSMKEKNKKGQNRELLFCINELLEEQGMNKGDIQGIMAVMGSGGFTSTRIAAVVANTFAYVAKIPVLAVTKDQVGNIQDLIPKLLKQPNVQYISPAYSGEPNIGKKK